MKAITLIQPWATLVAIGAKHIETRSWSTPYHGPLAIHAAKGFPEWARERFFDLQICKALEVGGIRSLYQLPLGAIIATCTLVDCVRITRDNAPPMPEFCFGDFTPWRWAWHLSDVKVLTMPMPARGKLGLWEVNLHG
jgi:hypothetical protein